MSLMQEKTPLLSPSVGESGKFYFVGKSNEDYQGGKTVAVRDADGQQVVEGLPPGSSEQEFAPRILTHHKARQRLCVCVRVSACVCMRDFDR
jgi:hypothetical protein